MVQTGGRYGPIDCCCGLWIIFIWIDNGTVMTLTHHNAFWKTCLDPLPVIHGHIQLVRDWNGYLESVCVCVYVHICFTPPFFACLNCTAWLSFRQGMRAISGHYRAPLSVRLLPRLCVLYVCVTCEVLLAAISGMCLLS